MLNENKAYIGRHAHAREHSAIWRVTSRLINYDCVPTDFCHSWQEPAMTAVSLDVASL